MSTARTLFRDVQGAAIVEFALIAPLLLMLLLGMFELGYNFYIQSQLQGAVQKAARDATLESANSGQAATDAKVTKAVRAIVPSASLAFSRRAYSSFNDVNRPEDYTDVNGDGACNDGEPFEDANGSGAWDEDRGIAGGGGARDAVLYVVRVNYVRAFGAAKLVGLSDTVTTEAVTVLRNQPWDRQQTHAQVGSCI